MKTLRYKGGSNRTISSADMRQAFDVKSDDIVVSPQARLVSVSNKVADVLLKNMDDEFELTSEAFSPDIEEEDDTPIPSGDEAPVSGGHPLQTDPATAKQVEG